MIPLKDDIPTDRLPLVTLLLVLASAVPGLAVADAGTLPLLTSAVALWLFGTSVEDAMSRPRFAAFCLLGGGAALALRALDPDGTSAVALAAAGVAGAAVAAHLRLYPAARVVGVVPIPFAGSVAAVPAWTFALAWVALQVVYALTAIAGPLADGGAVTLLAAGGGALAGLLAVGLLAQRRKRHPAPLANPLPS